MSVKVNSKLVWNGAAAIKDFNVSNEEALTTSAIIVQNAAVKNAPKKTGALKASITRLVKKINAFIGTPLEYAPFPEFGTRFQKAQPYLRPALLLNIDKIKAIFKKLYKAVKYVD
jgi:HK97 gp10 family phage protein